MSLPTCNLDDRTFQDIVNEAKSRISRLCPAWTDHNLSDPGVTLVELFAWMTEMILYRLNQVPEKHHIKLLELLGLTLEEPQPARTELTFSLSAPQTEEVIVIPQGTEVATKRTEAERPIIFQTDKQLVVRPAKLIALVAERRNPGSEPSYQPYNLSDLNQNQEDTYVEAFCNPPNRDDALYFGFEHDLSQNLLELDLTCQPAFGLGIDTFQPPWQWEVWYSDAVEPGAWQPVEIEKDGDGTGGLNHTGKIELRLPDMTEIGVNDQWAYWLRCRVEPEAAPAEKFYRNSPRINTIKAKSWGGFVWASHAAVVYREALGRSDGTPGQVFCLAHTPLLTLAPGETIEVREPGQDWQPWQKVPNFAHSEPDSKHFTCDKVTGEIRFGPALRQPDGQVRCYGAIPPRGAEIRFTRYRYGGGVEGNVQAGQLIVLKTTIPYVARVTNRHNATGGLDAETIERAKIRALDFLQTRERAVTGADYEFLARQADRRVARAHCLASTFESRRREGSLELLLVPWLDQPEQPLSASRLALSEDLINAVQRDLDKYRLLTVHLEVRQPTYISVAVELSLIANHETDLRQIEKQVEAQLYQFLNPITGGPAGGGWPFGRPLYLSDIYACLRHISGLEFIETVRLYQIHPEEPTRTEITGYLEVLADGLIISAKHKVSARRSNNL